MDQYSLACIYHEMRVGHVPFSERPEDRMTIDAELSAFSAKERRVLARALHRDPTKRWADCRTFALKLADANREVLPSELLEPYTPDQNVAWENYYLKEIVLDEESPWANFLRNKESWTIPPQPESLEIDQLFLNIYAEE